MTWWWLPKLSWYRASSKQGLSDLFLGVSWSRMAFGLSLAMLLWFSADFGSHRPVTITIKLPKSKRDDSLDPVLYPVSHPIEPRDFVIVPFMTCDCPIVWLGLAFESATFVRFSEKPRGSTGWESGQRDHKPLSNNITYRNQSRALRSPNWPICRLDCFLPFSPRATSNESRMRRHTGLH